MGASRVVRAIGDLAAALLAYYGAWWLRGLSGFGVFRGPIGPELYGQVSHPLWLILPSQLALLFLLGLYRAVDGHGLLGLVRRLLSALALQVLLLAAFYFFTGEFFPKSVLAVFFALNLALTRLWRLVPLDALARGEVWRWPERAWPGRVTVWREKAVPYLKARPGAPFILLFMALLMSCAFLLIAKQEKVAESVANWAYLALVVGVLLELIQTIRESRS